MSESYSATAFWRSRAESMEEWAGRAERFFRLLAECHPRLVKLIRAGRFDALMKNVSEETRRWAARVMDTRRS